jgi:3-dehydroquinate synthetase
MLAALAIGRARSLTTSEAAEAVSSLIEQLGPLPRVDDVAPRDVLAAMGRDKKVVAGTLHFVAASVLGKTVTLTDVTDAEVRSALRGLATYSVAVRASARKPGTEPRNR